MRVMHWWLVVGRSEADESREKQHCIGCIFVWHFWLFFLFVPLSPISPTHSPFPHFFRPWFGCSEICFLSKVVSVESTYTIRIVIGHFIFQAYKISMWRALFLVNMTGPIFSQAYATASVWFLLVKSSISNQQFPHLFFSSEMCVIDAHADQLTQYWFIITLPPFIFGTVVRDRVHCSWNLKFTSLHIFFLFCVTVNIQYIQSPKALLCTLNIGRNQDEYKIKFIWTDWINQRDMRSTNWI